MGNVLLGITMEDNITQHFEYLLVDMLNYSANILLKDFNYYTDKHEEYKEFVDAKDVKILFVEDKGWADGFDVAVYCQGGSIKEWEYLDNITRDAFEDGTKFLTKEEY